MNDRDIVGSDLLEIAAAIREKRVSSVRVTEAAIARAREVNSALNAFVRIDESQALSDARRADDDLAAGRLRGPLHGVPMAHKDMFYRKGVASGGGSRILGDTLASRTAAPLLKLDAAGALQFGVLNMSEFAYGVTGHNYHIGHCGNPFRPTHITGGSSSGSASSVGARANFGALGSDTGASVRFPAGLCGVTGLKTTWGRVSRAGYMPLCNSLDTIGVLARSAADCALLGQTIAGSDADDALTASEPVGDWLGGINTSVRGLRLGVPANFYFDDLHTEVDGAVRASLDVFRQLGVQVVPVPVPDIAALNAACLTVLSAEASAVHANWLRQRPQDYSDQVRGRLEQGLLVPATSYINALRWRADALRQFNEQVFSQVDAFITPVATSLTPSIAETDVGGGAAMADMILVRLPRNMRSINYLGVPAVAYPAGFFDGMPIGAQLVGPCFSEGLLLRLVHQFQQASNFHRRAPAV